MYKIILISLVIFFAICSKSWAEEDYNNKKQQLINDALKTAGIPECGGSPKVGGQVTWNNCWGSYTWTNGNFYIGAFKNGKKHGFGTQVIISSGTILQGRWVENRCEDCKRIEKEQEERYKEQNSTLLKELRDDITGRLISDGLYGFWGNYFYGYGQRYGMQPEVNQINGWFTINERNGKFMFSSDLKDKLIILEYISDGLGYDQDMRVPKLAEEAVYAYLSHAILASRINQPEYVVQRLRREKSAKLRNAKIRLSNIKSNEFIQIMRGKSKWLKN